MMPGTIPPEPTAGQPWLQKYFTRSKLFTTTEGSWGDVVKKSVEKALALSELRGKINDLAEDTAAEDRDRLTGEYRALESEYRAALIAEDDTGEGRTSRDGQSAELRRMLDGFNVGKVFQAASNHEQTEGAERELQQHFGLTPHSIPIEALRTEHRAAATFTGDEPNAVPKGIIAQVFPQSVANFAGVMGETVPTGEAVHPVITTGATVHRPAASANAAEGTAAITVSTLAPRRIQASFAYAREDAAVFGGLDAALRMNLRDALQDDMDDYILNSTDVGLLQFGTDPTNPTAATDGAGYLSAMYGAVDGTYSGAISDVRMVVGSAIYAHMASVVPTGRDDSALDILSARSGGIRVGGNVPAYANNRQDCVIVKGMNADNAVAPLWQGISIFQDEFTRAEHGEVKLFAVMLMNFAVLRADGYTRHRFRNA